MDRFFGVVSGIFTPIVPVLMAAGMVGALLTVLDLTGILPATSPTYYVWNLIKEAGFYFLPFYVSYTAAQKLGANPFLSMLLAGVLLHPQLSDFSSLGVEQLSFFGLGIRTASYSSTILPVILSVWLLSYVEKFFSKICPQVIRSFSVPMLSTMIVVPVMLLIIGPAGSFLADYMAAFVQYLGDNLGFVSVGIIAALTPIMIATGTHSFAFPVIVTTLAMTGYEALIVPAMLAENLAMAGAAFAVGFTTKDKDLKQKLMPQHYRHAWAFLNRQCTGSTSQEKLLSMLPSSAAESVESLPDCSASAFRQLLLQALSAFLPQSVKVL